MIELNDFIEREKTNCEISLSKENGELFTTNKNLYLSGYLKGINDLLGNDNKKDFVDNEISKYISYKDIKLSEKEFGNKKSIYMKGYLSFLLNVKNII